MPKVLYCDDCNSQDGVSEDYEGVVLCRFHRAKYDLKHRLREYKEKREWVKSVWLSELANRRQEILRLQNILKEYPEKLLDGNGEYIQANPEDWKDTIVAWKDKKGS